MNTLRCLLIALVPLLLIKNVNAVELTETQKREIIFDCTQLVNDYGYYRDLRDPVGFANIFSEDARLKGGGKWHAGRKEIAQHVLDDDMSTVSMHMMTTIKIFPVDLDNATGITYAAVAHEPGVKDSPAELGHFAVLGKYTDKFKRTAEGWKISERTFTVVFRKPSTAKK